MPSFLIPYQLRFFTLALVIVATMGFAAGWLAMMYGDALVSGYLRVSGLAQ